MSASELEWKTYLLENGIIEGYTGVKKRANILSFLRSLIPSFIRLCVKENNTKRDDFQCQLLPFGSYGLGGQTKGGDMDVVLLAPIAIHRRDFLVLFSKLLKIQPIICDMEVIPHAGVPIIKCRVDSIDIDISFIRLQMPTVPFDIDFLDDTFVHDLENTCLASADGPRVNQFILKHIYPNDMPVFRLALQTIKHWANQRCIYNKPMGYLNGGSWTLLLVKTYFDKRSQIATVGLIDDDEQQQQHSRSASEHSDQSPSSSILSTPESFSRSPSPLLSPSPYPYEVSTNTTSTSNSSSANTSNTSNTTATGDTSFASSTSSSSSASSSVSSNESSPTVTAASLFSPPQTISFIALLKAFFSMWSTWPWPEPVMLTKSIPIIPEQHANGVTSIKTIDAFKNSVLPIITPCYPVGNAAPFVTQSTLSVMTKELHRAHKILQHEHFDDPNDMKDKLFKPLNIVKEYKHFIKVTVSCETSRSHDIWSRKMATHLPKLVQLLESLHEIKLARPFTQSYSEVISYRTQHDKYLLQNGYGVDAFDALAPLNPGTLFMKYYLVGLEFNDSYKHTLVDMSDISQAFATDMDGRKNNRDNDVHVHLAAIKRRQVAMMIDKPSF